VCVCVCVALFYVLILGNRYGPRFVCVCVALLYYTDIGKSFIVPCTSVETCPHSTAQGSAPRAGIGAYIDCLWLVTYGEPVPTVMIPPTS